MAERKSLPGLRLGETQFLPLKHLFLEGVKRLKDLSNAEGGR